MNCKKENLLRIYYAIETAERLLNEGMKDFGDVVGCEEIEYELAKIGRLMEIVSEDMLHLVESEVE